MAVDLRGAAGGTGGAAGSPGYGARVQSYFSVNPGTMLNVFVGCQGAAGSSAVNGQYNSNNGLAGYNGGGAGFGLGSGGGGATDIRIGGTAYANRIIVAGGGGGKYIDTNCGNNPKGGDGGKFGSSSTAVGGSCPALGSLATGGDWTAGGTAGNSLGGTPAATNGGLGVGGKGGYVSSGGGGGGYYGGTVT
jgi:hypothetical protein